MHVHQYERCNYLTLIIFIQKKNIRDYYVPCIFVESKAASTHTKNYNSTIHLIRNHQWQILFWGGRWLFPPDFYSVSTTCIRTKKTDYFIFCRDLVKLITEYFGYKLQKKNDFIFDLTEFKKMFQEINLFWVLRYWW